MSADLKQLNKLQDRDVPLTQFSSKLSRTIAALYVFTFVTVSIGTGFALYQNWAVRLEQAQSRLVRTAHVGNFLVETALTSAAKSLDSTQLLFSEVLQMGSMDKDLASQLLSASYAKFRVYNQTDGFGLMFFVDHQGRLVAQSEGQADTAIDMSDRQYFHLLRDHPRLQRTVGPLVFARTTGQWVFHMSVPVYGKNGEFSGVLVQQILENDIADKLVQYADNQHFEHMVTHIEGREPSFVYPPPGTSQTPTSAFLWALAHQRTGQGQKGESTEHLLTGFAKSQAYDLGTYTTFPVSQLRYEFWVGNQYLILYAVIGILFSTAIFYYLFNLSKRLSFAQRASSHDPLTRLHNRRALDERLPQLLRASQRAQTPISVLFIDIDHFRFFNENYGHESGDVALKAVAQTIQSCARRPLDFVCRWGGEEFVVVLPETNRQAAIKVADNILNAVRAIELESIQGDRPRLTVSIGLVTHTILAESAQEDLVDQADKAMLEAKIQGRDRRVESVHSV